MKIRMRDAMREGRRNYIAKQKEEREEKRKAREEEETKKDPKDKLAEAFLKSYERKYEKPKEEKKVNLEMKTKVELLKMLRSILESKKKYIPSLDRKKKAEIIELINEQSKSEPKKEEKVEEDLSIDAWLQKLVALYLEEEGNDRTVEEVIDAGDYTEVLEEAILENGGHDDVARMAMKNLMKKGRSKRSLLAEMKEMKDEGYTMFDDILDEEVKRVMYEIENEEEIKLKKLREAVKEASINAQKVYEDTKKDRFEGSPTKRLSALQKLVSAEYKIKKAKSNIGVEGLSGGKFVELPYEEWKAIRDKYYTKG